MLRQPCDPPRIGGRPRHRHQALASPGGGTDHEELRSLWRVGSDGAWFGNNTTLPENKVNSYPLWSQVYVGSDGLLNLKAPYAPQVRYDFIAGATAADVEDQGKQAPGFAIALGDRIRVDVEVHASYHLGGTCSGRSCGGTHRGMGRRPGGRATPVNASTTVPTPTCSFAQLWKVALGHGVPANLVANIGYDNDGYDFRVLPEDYRATFDTNCALKRLWSPPKSNPRAVAH